MAYEGDLESELDMLEWLTDRATLSLSGAVEEVNPQMLARLIEDETDVVVLIYRFDLEIWMIMTTMISLGIAYVQSDNSGMFSQSAWAVGS